MEIGWRRRTLSPRKTARQARSRATVEALLEATADILIRHRYAKLTTNRTRRCRGRHPSRDRGASTGSRKRRDWRGVDYAVEPLPAPKIDGITTPFVLADRQPV